jgi:GNAT superfamily N-acetyltransferase
MRKWMNLVERGEVTHSVAARGFYSGQQDLTMNFKVGGTLVGWIDYSVYEDEVHVQMIKVRPEHRRQGFGTMMLRQLQAQYPETEIELGMLTPDGAALIAAVPKKEVPNGDVAEKKAEIEALEAKLAHYHDLHNDLMSHVGEEDFEQRREDFLKQVDDWNDIHDRISDLEQEIGYKNPVKRIFEFANV